MGDAGRNSINIHQQEGVAMRVTMADVPCTSNISPLLCSSQFMEMTYFVDVGAALVLPFSRDCRWFSSASRRLLGA